MKFIKFAFIYFLSLILVGCTYSDKTLNTQKETLYAFALDKDNLYIAGQLYDYQVSAKNEQEFLDFLHSDLIKKVANIKVDDIRHKVKSREVSTHITFDLDKNLTKEQKELLKNKFSEHSNELKSVDFYLDNINLIKLENKAQILEKGKLSKPIMADFVNHSEKITGVDEEALVMSVGLGSLLIVTAPVWVPIAFVDFLFN